MLFTDILILRSFRPLSGSSFFHRKAGYVQQSCSWFSSPLGVFFFSCFNEPGNGISNIPGFRPLSGSSFFHAHRLQWMIDHILVFVPSRGLLFFILASGRQYSQGFRTRFAAENQIRPQTGYSFPKKPSESLEFQHRLKPIRFQCCTVPSARVLHRYPSASQCAG